MASPRSLSPLLALGLCLPLLCLLLPQPALAWHKGHSGSGSGNWAQDQVDYYLQHLKDAGYTTLVNLTNQNNLAPSLVSALQQGYSPTILAPTNAAFSTYLATCPSPSITPIILDHVLQQKLPSNQLLGYPLNSPISTFGADKVVVTSSQPLSLGLVDSTNFLLALTGVVQADLIWKTGAVIHGISSVLAAPRYCSSTGGPVPPPANVTLAWAQSQVDYYLQNLNTLGYTTLVTVLQTNNLSNALVNALVAGYRLTILAPTNAAFSNFLATCTNPNITAIILDHVLQQKLPAKKLKALPLGQTVSTFGADNVAVVQNTQDLLALGLFSTTSTQLASADVVQADLIWKTGAVIHGIGAVLGARKYCL